MHCILSRKIQEGRARALLAHGPVADDRQLVQLATDLTRLEDEVART